jgi:hypothetical protein
MTASAKAKAAPPDEGLPSLLSGAPARAEADGAALTDAWLADGELVDPAHAEVLASGDYQTALPPPPADPPPRWLEDLLNAIGRFFEFTGPALRYVLIGLAILLALFLLYKLVPGFAAWFDERFRRAPEAEDPNVGVAEASAARARLADADALASEGRFDEAVHILLYRSIDDISARRPGLVKPAVTSRDLAVAPELPGVARGAFSAIARAVEVSLFGGRSIDASVWQDCRAAYSELTVPRNWAAA